MSQSKYSGAWHNLIAVTGGDIVSTVEVTADGSPRDLSSASIEVVVEDVRGNCSPRTIGTYSQTITDAANGLFTFKIPYTALINLDGEEASYKLFITENGDRRCRMSGNIIVQEVI